MEAALLSFNFDHRALILWLRGKYTNDARNWNQLAEKISDACRPSPASGYPKLEPELAMRVFTKGAPLAGRFISKQSHMIRHLRYDNHPPAQSAADDVRKKFAKEEANGFHVTYPHFTALFISGLMLSPISWIVQKGKGRLIVDASTKLVSPDDTGAPNHHIPPPGQPGKSDEKPTSLPWLGSTPASRSSMEHAHRDPRADLLQHTDDIDSVFRRMLYHPDLAVVFAYVRSTGLSLGSGQI
jgi:hypothetical protein